MNHILGGTDALTEVVRVVPLSYFGNGPLVNPVNPGQWIKLYEFSIQFAAPVSRALIMAMVETTIPPDPGMSQSCQIRASVNGEYNDFIHGQSINSQISYQNVPLTLVAVQELEFAAQTWTVAVEYFGNPAPHARDGDGIIVLPCD